MREINLRGRDHVVQTRLLDLRGNGKVEQTGVY